MDSGWNCTPFQRRGRAGQLAVAHAHDLAVVGLGGHSSSAGSDSRSIASEW
jgi:hypothetical protein